MKTLERTLGLPYVVAISIAAMLGSGIFVLPGIAAASTGPSIWLAYMFAALCVLPAALSKSELATAMPTSGGTYVYVDRAFGPVAGTITGLGLWLAFLLKSAFALVGFGAYMQLVADVSMKSVSMGFLVAIIAINIVGMRQASKILVVVVAVAIVALIGLVAVARATGETAPQGPFFSGGAGGFLGASAYVFISYAGVTKVAAVAEEIKDPGRNLPRGILISLLIVTLLYIFVVSTLVDIFTVEALFDDFRPIHTMSEKVFGSRIGLAFAVLGVVTMASMANAGVLASSRFPFAMARDRLLPPWIATIHPRFLTPVASIILTGMVMAVCILVLDIEGIAKLASAFEIMILALENIVLMVLRESNAPWYKPKYRAPLYPFNQILGLVLCLILLAVMGWVVLTGILCAVIPGLLLYVVYGRRRAERRGQFMKVGRRRDLVSASSSPSNPHLDTEPELMGDAAVVVLLVGNERSPEVLVEVGAALADGKLVEVVHITEVPEQTALDAMTDDDPAVIALRRRVNAMGDEKDILLKFDAVVSRDVVETAFELANRLHCDWLVMEWRGRGRNRFLFLSPLGWLLNHLPCKLALFKDEGVRYFRHLLVDAEPGPDDSLVVSTADHLAELEGAELTFVRHVPTDAPPTAVQGQADYIDQLRDLCSSPTHSLILRGGARDEAVGDVAALYDLLVTSAPPGAGSLWDVLRPSKKDLLKERAACSVLSLKNPRVLTAGAHDHSSTGRFQQDGEIDLTEFIEPALLGAKLPLNRKEALFAHFAEAFAQSVAGVDAERIAEALWQRERAQNTSVGEGVAMPHATIPRAARARVGVFTAAAPVDWQGPDGSPVDVFFVTLGPPSERQTHLLLLSTIATLVLKSSLLERLRAAETDEELHQALTEGAAALRS